MRNRDSIAIVSSIERLYSSSSEVDWDELERISGHNFTEAEKIEVVKCANVYAEEKSFIDQSASKKDVDELRAALITHASGICQLAERYQPVSNSDTEADKRTMLTLTLLHSTAQISVFEALHEAASAASLLLEALRSEPHIPPHMTKRTGEVEALSGFIHEVLARSTRKAARNQHPNGALSERKPGFEYCCWGMVIGGRSRKFPPFAAALLKRAVSGDQIRNAWPCDPHENVRGYFDENID